MDFVKGLTTYLTKYLDAFIQVKENYFVMKWEDLIGEPSKTIQAIGQALNLNIPIQVAEQIWQPLDHKNLLLYHKHNYRKGKGIAGDWKNSLINEHMALFREAGLNSYLKELDYPLIPDINPRGLFTLPEADC